MKFPSALLAAVIRARARAEKAGEKKNSRTSQLERENAGKLVDARSSSFRGEATTPGENTSGGRGGGNRKYTVRGGDRAPFSYLVLAFALLPKTRWSCWELNQQIIRRERAFRPVIRDEKAARFERSCSRRIDRNQRLSSKAKRNNASFPARRRREVDLARNFSLAWKAPVKKAGFFPCWEVGKAKPN